MNHTITESERLKLCFFREEDGDFILELLNTEGWLEYIGDRNVHTKEQAIAYLQNGPIKSYRTHGFGLSLVILKETGASIGMCGLVKRDFMDHADLGFAFLPAYTGKGYASEIAAQTLAYGFGELKQEQIDAITLPSNTACIRLLEKTGFQFERNIIYPDSNEELGLYSVDKVKYKD